MKDYAYMGLHDTLARKAHEQGHTSDAVQAIAQGKAGEFWIYLGITVILWWVAYGYLWAIPAALALWRAWESISATRVQVRLMRIEQGSRRSS